MEILKLLPAGKDYIWGGTRLRSEYGKRLSCNPLAETWECSVHPDGLSIVANGVYAGDTLAEVLRRHPQYLGRKTEEKGGLPILVKFIDAKYDLSIQVHPGDDYARVHENDNGKTEMWYVMDAEEGASLIYGFEHSVTTKQIREAVETGNLGKHLHKVKIKKGDVYYVPAGIVHGIGAGTLLAEIQESSNVTYRVYDYDRIGADGRKRELHLEEAFAVMDMSSVSGILQKTRLVHYYPGCCREILCRCKYFEVERVQVRRVCSFSVLEASFQVLLCLNGSGDIETGENKRVYFTKGDCMFLPAGIGRCHLQGETELLKIRC